MVGIYIQSKSAVHLYSVLPTFPEKDGACSITFKSLKLRNATITLEHSDIISVLFKGLGTAPEMGQRGFIPPINNFNNNNEFYVRLGGTEIILNKNEVNQLCLIVDELAEEYLNSLINIENTVKSSDFAKSSQYQLGYRLIKVKRSLWRKMITFACQHDYQDGDSQWHIFDWNDVYIKVYSKDSNERYDAGYHVFLYPEQVECNYIEGFKNPDNDVWIVAKLASGYTFDKKLSDVNERKVWDVLTTYRWLTNEFLPQVIIYENNKKEGFLDLFKEFDKRNIDVKEFYESGIIEGGLRPENVTDKNQLYSFVLYMQNFYCIPKDDIYLTKEEVKGLYEAVALCILRTSFDDYSFIKNRLMYNAEGNSPEAIYQSIMNHTKTLASGVYNYSFIENIMRCLVVPLSKNKGYLNQKEIEKIICCLLPFYNKMNTMKFLSKVL